MRMVRKLRYLNSGRDLSDPTVYGYKDLTRQEIGSMSSVEVSRLIDDIKVEGVL